MQTISTNNNYTVDYRTHKRARNIKISIKNSKVVTVTSPPLTPRFVINRFLNQSQGWIDSKMAQLESQKSSETVSKTEVMLFGKKYQLVNEYDDKQPIGVVIKGSKVYVNQISRTSSMSQLTRFLKSTAKHYILERTEKLAQKMSLKFNKVSLKQQSTRWGSCSSKKNLNFNWRLIHFEPKIIDYVIIHEIAHLRHMNHSSKFWQLVEKFDSEYRKHRLFLKRQSGMEQLK